MKTQTYETRAEQVADFQKLVEAGKKPLAEALRDACFIGAVEEQERILFILRRYGCSSRSMGEIVGKNVLETLGFEKPAEKKTRSQRREGEGG